MRRHEACNENRHTDCKRAATDPQQFIEVPLNRAGAVGEISPEGFGEFRRCLGLSFGVRKVNDDLDWLVWSEFARPADNIFLRLSVQVSLSKRIWVKRMKKLSNIVNTQLDHVFTCECHGFDIQIVNDLPGCRHCATAVTWPPSVIRP